MSNREQVLRELIARWGKDVDRHHYTDAARVAIDRCKRELEAALALPADAAEPLKSLAENYERQINEIQEICLEAGIVPVEEGGDCKTIVEAVRRLASPSAVLTEERRQELIEKVLKLSIDKRLTFQDGQILSEVADLLTAPAPPMEQEQRNESWKEHWKKVNAPTAAKEVRRDRIDNVTRDTPGEGKL